MNQTHHQECQRLRSQLVTDLWWHRRVARIDEKRKTTRGISATAHAPASDLAGVSPSVQRNGSEAYRAVPL
jgi:hypothetical protein